MTAFIQSKMTNLLIYCFCALTLTFSEISYSKSPEAYPGYMWGTVTRDYNSFEGWGFQGVFNQSIRWTTLPGDIALKTYAAYGTRFRTNHREYFDAYGPGLGLELTWKFINLGTVYEWRKYPRLNEKTKSFSIYTTWYKRLDLIKPQTGQPNLFGLPVRGFPLSMWGQIYSDFNRIEGIGSMGWINQGIEWFQLPENIVFRTLATYHWRFRSKNHKYFDMHGPGLGIDFERYSMNLGLEYSWQYYPSLSTKANDWYLYLTWYLDWNLK